MRLCLPVTCQVSARYHIPRGTLQQLQNNAGMFYGMAYRYCEEAKFTHFQRWFLPFKTHLTACLSVRVLFGFDGWAMDALPFSPPPHKHTVVAHRLLV